MTRADAAASRRILAAAAASFVAAALVMAPVVGAGFHPEDFGWLALARLSPSPWPLFVHNIDFVYFYRPLPLLLWWLAAHVLGTAATWHNAIDVLLHALNAALLCGLATRLSGRTGTGVVAGLVFACLPAGAGTAAWMSDRFDTVALAFSLAALLAFEAGWERRRAAWWAGLWLLCALLSKEVAYAAAAVMLLRVLLGWREAPRALIAAVVIAPLLGIALRLLSGTAMNISLDVGNPVATIAAGLAGWWRQAPAALGGFLPAPGLAVLIGLSLLGGMFNAAVRTTPPMRTLLVTGAGLLVLPAALQSPVTAPVLVHDESTAFTENLRFYYMACAGLALLLAAGYATTRSVVLRWGMCGALLVSAAYGAILSHQLGAKWANDWRAPSDAYLTLGAELGQRPFPIGCRIFLDTPEWTDAFRHHADTIVKAVAPVSAPVQACAIFSGAQVYQTFLPADRCSAAQWPGLAFSERHGVEIAGSVGAVCMLQFETYTTPGQLGSPLLRFRVDRSGHAQEVPD